MRRASKPLPIACQQRSFTGSFVAIFAYGVANPVDEVEELADAGFLFEEFVFAIVFLGVLLARFIYMRSSRPRALPNTSPKIMLRFARVVHTGLYASLAMLGLSGLMIGGMYAFAGHGGAIFEILLWLHEAFYWLSLNLIALHIVGAIYHRYHGDGVWSSMVPLFSEKSDVPPAS